MAAKREAAAARAGAAEMSAAAPRPTASLGVPRVVWTAVGTTRAHPVWHTSVDRGLDASSTRKRIHRCGSCTTARTCPLPVRRSRPLGLDGKLTQLVHGIG